MQTSDQSELPGEEEMQGEARVAGETKPPGEVDQEEWERGVPGAVSRDLLWKLHVYRAALFLLHCATRDARELRKRRREAIADQLVRAAGSVSANIAEGYSRSGPADRVRFFDYALGSARECITWYQAAADVFPLPLTEARQDLLGRIRGMTLRLISAQRARTGVTFKRGR
jgi:four helix bundle protein